MDSILLTCRLRLNHPLSEAQLIGKNMCTIFRLERELVKNGRVNCRIQSDVTARGRKPPKYVRYPRRSKLPLDPGIYIGTHRKSEVLDQSQTNRVRDEEPGMIDGSLAEGDGHTGVEENEGQIGWEVDEIEAISSLFQGRIPQKPRKLHRERPLPLSLPYRLRPLGLPTKKEHVKKASSSSVASESPLPGQVYKDPAFLLNLAREIGRLDGEENVSLILNNSRRFLRKGSLSLTIRELGHMGLPERALQTFCWAQKQPHLFPDDGILASTVEVLARTHELKLPFDLEKFISLASRGVLEAIARGFIKGGSLNLALKILIAARKSKRVLNASIYAKLILELGKIPDRYDIVVDLLEDLANRDDLNLSQQDCTAIMKVCVKLGRFELVEGLFNWFKHSGNEPSVVMYTTMIHSRYSEKKYREALALVWAMEGSNCLFDLPAYRVVIKLFVALNDLSRAVRYFSKLKEAGFYPTYDLYRDMICIYLVNGRLAKCKEICKESDLAGFKLDAQLRSQILQLGGNMGSAV